VLYNIFRDGSTSGIYGLGKIVSTSPTGNQTRIFGLSRLRSSKI